MQESKNAVTKIINGDRIIYKISAMINAHMFTDGRLSKSDIENHIRNKFAEEIAEEIKNKLKICMRSELLKASLLYETFFAIREGSEDPEIELLKHLQSWISADKIPPENTLLLLSFKNLDYPLPGYYKSDNIGGAFYLVTSNETCISMNLFVNAWQVSDLPYREEEI